MQNIVVTGPIGVGKSVVSRSLAMKLNNPLYIADRLRWYYFAKFGFCEIKFKALASEGSEDLADAYYKSFEAAAVQSMMQEFSGGILDLGGGMLHFKSSDDRLKIGFNLKMERKVFCLLPSPDQSRSVEILNSRIRSRHRHASARALEPIFRLNEQLVKFYFESDIQMETIFVGNKSVLEITQDLEGLINEYERI
jgi:shikimate kinase